MPPMNFGLIGCGAMGSEIAKAFDAGDIPGTLKCVYDAAPERAQKLSESLKSRPYVSPSAGSLMDNSDFVIEAASQDAVREYAAEALKKGKCVLIMSVGALMDGRLAARLKADASKSGASLYLPSGAVAGIDCLLAAACGPLEEVTLTSTKPPSSLKGVKYLVDKGIDVELITQPTVVYEGPASEAVVLFPKNVNVSAMVSLAAGKNVRVRLAVDPKAKTNSHEIRAKGAFGEMTAKTSNVPSPTNPATSYLAALSAVAVLKKVGDSVKVGG
jgi:aspartate dehydrogenase